MISVQRDTQALVLLQRRVVAVVPAGSGGQVSGRTQQRPPGLSRLQPALVSSKLQIDGVGQVLGLLALQTMLFAQVPVARTEAPLAAAIDAFQ